MNEVFAEKLKKRTKRFPIDVIRFIRKMPDNQETWVIGKQLLRSASSVAANYRASCRARSDQEFAAKLGVVVEEADESAFWLEIIQEAEVFIDDQTSVLEKEANELVAIMNTSRHKVLQRLKNEISIHNSQLKIHNFLCLTS